jgi:serpin B
METVMRSRRLVSVGLGMMLVASACGSGGSSEEMAAPDDVAVAEITERQDAPDVGEAALDAQSAANAQFALDLYAATVASEDGNVALGPYSVTMALAMTLAGAEGATAEEIAQAMHVADEQATHDALAALDLAVRDAVSDDLRLDIANQLWGQRDFEFEAAFLDLLAGHYGAPFALEDFENDAAGARERINDWVSDATQDKIPDLFPENAFNHLTRLVAVNAMYLDAPWHWQLDDEDTALAPWILPTGGIVQVPMMRLTPGDEPISLRTAVTDDWQAVELPYVGERLSMLVVEPVDFAAFEASLEASTLGSIDAALHPVAIDHLTMPKFAVDTELDLVPILQELGIRTAFERNAADFTGITRAAPLVVSGAYHRAVVEVDESGTEAAAATGMVFEDVSACLGCEEEIDLDNPFIFAIRDTETGAILFLGRVTDPRETAEP